MKEKEEKKEQRRYLMNAAVVTAKRISKATWEVTGPWHEPFYVNEEEFQKRFSEL